MRQNRAYCLIVGNGTLSLVQAGAAPDAAAPHPLAGASDQRVRIIDATLACLSRVGLAKTTLDDVARAAGCSRATVYRAFPGGKDALMTAVVDTEVSRLFSDLAVAMGAASDLEEVLVAGITGAARRIGGHRALAFLLEHEPEVVLPHLAFDHHDRLLAEVSSYAAPFLGRWLDHAEALRVAEWTARIVLSYLGCPAPSVDLTDAAHVRHLVRTFVLPGVTVLSGAPGRLSGAPAPSPTVPPVPLPGPTTTEGEAS
jgi:AcrR family transcriptional regulator